MQLYSDCQYFKRLVLDFIALKKDVLKHIQNLNGLREFERSPLTVLLRKSYYNVLSVLGTLHCLQEQTRKFISARYICLCKE